MTKIGTRARVLYMVYWGALEPLGRSLVVPAVLRLSRIGVEVTLVTFEKPGDLLNAEEVQKMRATFAGAGVRWEALRYHKEPKWPATAFDSLTAIAAAFRLRTTPSFSIVHARTFVAGPMGYVIARLLGARFIYHNEGFYPDEQVDGGVWRNGSFVHRVAKGIEAFLYDHADGIIALSERATADISTRTRVIENGTPVIVVPSAVDLESFRPDASPHTPTGAVRLVYLGSVGLRYRLDEAGRFLVALRKLRPESTLTVVSRAERSLVESMLDASGLPRDAWSLKELPHADVPVELRRHDAGLFFLTEGLSEHGCSPTKIGEYWACGLPVVTAPNVSDTDAVVRAERVGVVVRGRSSVDLETATLELLQLLEEEGLAVRCRRAATSAYSLEAACERQRELYGRVTASRPL